MNGYIPRILIVQGKNDQQFDLITSIIQKPDYVSETIPLNKLFSISKNESFDHFDMVIIDLRGCNPVCPPSIFQFRKDKMEVDTLLIISQKDSSLMDLFSQDPPGAAHLVYLVEPVSHVEYRVMIDHLSTQRRMRMFSAESSRVAKKLSLDHMVQLDEMTPNLLEEGLLEKIITDTCKTAVHMFNVDHSACVLFDWDRIADQPGASGVIIAEYPTLPTGSLIEEKIPVKGVPVEEQLIYKQEPIELTDVAEHEGFKVIRHLPLKHRICSILLVPVIIGGRVIASFSLDAVDTHRYFSDEEKNLCQKMAGQVALVISKIEKEQEASEIRKAWNAAQKVTEVATHGSIEETMNCIVQTLVEDIGIDIATLYIFDQASNKFVRRFVYGCDLTSTREPSTVSEASAVWRILNLDGKPFHYAEDARNDDLFKGDFVNKEDVDTAFGMRLSFGDEHVGVFFANYRRKTKAKFKWYQLNALVGFGHQAAVSIKTALLAEQASRQKKMMDSLYAAGEVLPEEESIASALQRIVDAAHQAVESPEGEKTAVSYIALVQRNSNVVRIEAASPPKYLERLRNKVRDIDLDLNEPLGILGRAIRDGKTQFEPDVKNAKHYIEVFPNITAQISVPLKVGDTVIGSLTVEKATPPALTHDERENLEHLAGHATSIIQASRQLELMTGLLCVGSDLGVYGDGTDIKRLLKGIADVVRGMFGCDTVAICSYDQQNDEATLPVVISGERTTPSSFISLLETKPNYRFPIREMSKDSAIQQMIRGSEDFVFAPHSLQHPVFKKSSTVIDEHYQSCAGIRLRINREEGSQVVGIMFLNFRRQHKFEAHERREIRLFTQYTAYAMYTVQIHKLLAYMEDQNWIVSNQLQWKDQIISCVEGIKTTAQFINKELKDMSLPVEKMKWLEERFKKISWYASDISINTEPPGSRIQRGIKPVELSSLVRERLETIWDREWDNLSYVDASYTFEEPDKSVPLVAEVNPEWLNYSIDLIVDIAVDRILKDENHSSLVVRLHRRPIIENMKNERDDCVEIVFRDSESSSQKELLGPLYLEKNIQWRVAKSILISYGGNLSYNRLADGNGNMYVLKLPLYKQEDEIYKIQPMMKHPS